MISLNSSGPKLFPYWLSTWLIYYEQVLISCSFRQKQLGAQWAYRHRSVMIIIEPVLVLFPALNCTHILASEAHSTGGKYSKEIRYLPTDSNTEFRCNMFATTYFFFINKHKLADTITLCPDSLLIPTMIESTHLRTCIATVEGCTILL